MEFDNLDSRPGKSWNFVPGHGKSWNLMFANLYAAYCSGLSEMYAGKDLKLWQIWFPIPGSETVLSPKENEHRLWAIGGSTFFLFFFFKYLSCEHSNLKG